jgi:undecaprenyl-diphosphatase
MINRASATSSGILGLYRLAIAEITAITGLWGLALMSNDLLKRPLEAFDQTVGCWLRNVTSRIFDMLMRSASLFGNTSVLGSVSSGMAAYLYVINARLEAMFLLLASMGGALIGNGLKLFFRRERPSFRKAGRFLEANGYGFPSGHAAAAAGFFLFLVFLWFENAMDPRLGAIVMVAALCLILLVGMSRIYLGVHYPSDVLVGFVLGGFWTGVMVLVFKLVSVSPA